MQESDKNNAIVPGTQLEEETIPKVDTSNLTVGMIVKNYKEMCNLLEDKIKDGNSQKAQLTDWQCYFDWEKSGQKFIITDIYDNPLTKEDKRRFGNNKCHYSVGKESYKVENDLSVRKGVYKIQQGENIYIGSTIRSFRRRFLDHYSNKTGTMPYTQKMLNDGGEYSVLWVAPENATESEIRKKEQFFIREYANNKEYHLINRSKKTFVLRERKRKPVAKNSMKNILKEVKKSHLGKGC